MKEFFDPTDQAEVLIPTYGTLHLIILLIVLFLLGLIIWKREQVKKLASGRSFKVKLIGTWAVIEIIYWALIWIYQVEPKYERFPLHLCGMLSTLLPLLILFGKNNQYWLRFFSYWALAAGFISFVNPGFEFTKPWSFSFIHYIIRHFMVMTVPIYLQITMNFKHTYRGFLVSLSSLAGWAVIIFLLDWATGANYMHLGQHNPNSIPFLPKSFTQWPYSLPSFSGVGIILLHLAYLSLNRLSKTN